MGCLGLAGSVQAGREETVPLPCPLGLFSLGPKVYFCILSALRCATGAHTGPRVNQASSECPHGPRPDGAPAPGGAGQDDVRPRGVPDPGGDPAGRVQVGQAQARGCRPVLGTRTPGAAGLTSRDSSVLGDTHSQAGDDEEAFDFFEQQDRVAGEGPPSLGLKDEDAEKSLEEEEEEEVLDPLGIMRSKKPKPQPKVAVKPRPSPRLTIFDEEVDPDERLFGPDRKLSPQGPAQDAPPTDPLKLFDDPDLGGAVPLGDSLLLLPAPRESGGPTSSSGRRDTSEELFRVEEDLDQILNLGAEPKPKPQPKPKPPVAAKPVLPRKPAVPPKAGPSEAGAGQQKPQQQIQAMDEMDILQYIRDHDTPAQAAPSLF
ncbi:HCLS1-binding protein 3 isoform X2 [Microcebus murinus]|uniref:HCLS1-binding protein 3 isoform X2 n=1 Tax=Microcebus murinus TaxID=30608 RepID=UPI003F6C890C